MVQPFLIDTGSDVTVFNAAWLQRRASFFGPQDPDGINGIGGSRNAWSASGTTLEIKSSSGVWTSVTPVRLLAINAKETPHILGRDVLRAHAFELRYNASRLTASLEN
jgi:hypothetical protein